MSLYIWGRVDFHRSISAPADDENIPLEFPVRIPKLPCGPIQSIAVGDQHCLFIADGLLFGFGSNKHRQLHHLALDVCDSPFTIVLPPSATGKPIQVSCGAYHSLVLLSDGSVMSAGLNEFDQLGQVKNNKDKTINNEPWRPWNRVALAVAADKVVASGNSSFALCGGNVYSWGCQKHGHLGHGGTGERERERAGAATFDNVEFPTKIQWFSSQRLRITDLAAGPAHLLCITDTDVYGVGDNSYGKVGVRSLSQVLTPQRIQIIGASDNEKVVGIAAGADQSLTIRELPSGARVVYSWGHIDKDSSCNPTQLAWGVPENTKFIAGGFDWHVLVTDVGEIRSWGYPRSTYNGCSRAMQSGPPDVSTSKRFPHPIASMEGKFVRLAAIGRTFAVCVCDDSKFVLPENGIPENTTLHCMVPKGHRYPKGFTARQTPDRFETAIRSFYKKLYGPTDAEKYFAEIPIASEALPVKKVILQKQGAHGLRIGSKVRVWMSDVYAWGTVLGRDLPNLPPSSFEVKWAREDWDPEVVELESDDETLDEHNEDRWQHLWVTGTA